MNKIVNKNTGESFEIQNIDTKKGFVTGYYRKDNYSEPIEKLYSLQHIDNESINSIVRDNMLESPEFTDFVKEENYVPIWNEPTYKYRVVFPKQKASEIIFKYPGFYEGLNRGTSNPRYENENYFKIYFNSFMAGACDILEFEYGLTIEKRDMDVPDPRLQITNVY